MTQPNVDQKWNEDLEKLQGEKGIQILSNDNKDVVSRLLKALKNVDGLPDHLDYPVTEEEAEAVAEFASKLYNLFCEGAEIAEAMMVGDEVEKAYNDSQDEIGNTRDMYFETAHKRSHF